MLPKAPQSVPGSSSPNVDELHILHLEASRLDAERVAATLAADGLRCHIHLVDTEDAFRAGLARPSIDVILADHSPPSFDGMSALRIARQTCPQVPFLFVSDAIGEDQAVETVKAGAMDYVLKDRLERLVPSVRRALHQARELAQGLQAEHALRCAHDEFELRVGERTRQLADANAALQAEILDRRRADDELQRVNKALRILSECNQALIRITDEPQLLQTVCQIAVDFGGYAAAWVAGAEHDEAKSIRPLAWAGCDYAFLEELHVTWADVDRGHGPTGTAIRTGRPAVTHDVRHEPDWAPWRQAALSEGIASAVSLPLPIDGQVVGAMTIYARQTDAFDETEVRLLQELTDDLGFGLSSLRARMERQKAVEALEISEARYRRIVQTAEEGICVLDDHDAIVFVNQKMAAMLSRGVEELLGRPMREFVHALDHSAFEDALLRRRAGLRDRHDVRLLAKDGSEIWGIIAGAPIVDEAGQYVGALKMVTDITQRKRLERDVAEISNLEQQRIGRDLHDVLGQNLTGISFLTKILEQKLTHLGLPEAAEAAEIGRLATLTNRQARALARGLASPDLTADSLGNKLDDLAAGMQDVFGITCLCRCDDSVRITGDDVAVHLYRIAQEAVNNSIRHGKARNVLIQLTERDGQNLLMIQDDGGGIPLAMGQHHGMGLQIMNYRASAIGGQLRIRSRNGQGTVITCSFG